MKKFTLFCTLSLILLYIARAQQNPPTEYGGGLKVSLSEDDQKYFRIITWHQFWLQGNNLPGPADFVITPTLRRSRFLMYAQLTDRFLILTHFGLNNLTPSGMHPTGLSPQAQLFMHDAWAEFKVTDWLFMGGGLHYWNGVSRLNSQSTLNFLPLDNPRHAWPTLGTSDQFVRHLGVYGKGKMGKLDYRVAWNFAMVSSEDAIAFYDPEFNDSTKNGGTLARADYIGRQVLGTDAQNIFSGYFNYQFLDQEDNKLPFFVGSYLGQKRVFNIGAGFFSHPKGSVSNLKTGVDSLGNTVVASFSSSNVLLWGVDIFTELPFGEHNAAFTGYLQFQNNDYGTNYQFLRTSQDVFTGSIIYLHAGVLLPNKGGVAWQPYVTATNKTIAAFDKNTTDFGIGINCLLTGHHSKLTLEYRSFNPIGGQNRGNITLQAVVFL
jgi:hypothetical protein